MKIEGADRLARKLKRLPDKQRAAIAAVIVKSAEEAERTAGILVPIGETGDLAETIHTEYSADGLSAELVAGDDTKTGQIKARAVEGGRAAGSKTGAMDARPYIGPTRALLAKKFKGRLKRAMNKAAKEVANGG